MSLLKPTFSVMMDTLPLNFGKQTILFLIDKKRVLGIFLVALIIGISDGARLSRKQGLRGAHLALKCTRLGNNIEQTENS